MREAFYSAVRGTADVAWKGFQWANRKVPARSFQPAWSPEPLPKSHERSKPPLGFPRRTDSLCPVCTREVRDAIVKGQEDLRALIDGHPGEIPADIVQRGQEIWMVKTCPKHGTFEDLMSSDADFFQPPRGELLRAGREDRQGQAPRARLVVDPLRPRRGPDGRPDEPLQHDVQPLLHGRQPGRLRPRADLGRREGDPRQRGLHQAEAAGLGPVLGRRADPLASLPRGDPLLEGDRLLRRPVRLQRHPLRAGAGVSRRPRPKRACASSTSSSTGWGTSTTSTGASGTSTTSSCAPSRTSRPPAST